MLLHHTDANIITPGTAFMAEVADFLRQWFRAKASGFPWLMVPYSCPSLACVARHYRLEANPTCLSFITWSLSFLCVIQVGSDPRFANLTVLVSDASEPAEGEHKAGAEGGSGEEGDLCAVRGGGG